MLFSFKQHYLPQKFKREFLHLKIMYLNKCLQDPFIKYSCALTLKVNCLHIFFKVTTNFFSRNEKKHLYLHCMPKGIVTFLSFTCKEFMTFANVIRMHLYFQCSNQYLAYNVCSITGTRLLNSITNTVPLYFTSTPYTLSIIQKYLIHSILYDHLGHYALCSLRLKQVCPKSLLYGLLQIFVLLSWWLKIYSGCFLISTLIQK